VLYKPVRCELRCTGNALEFLLAFVQAQSADSQVVYRVGILQLLTSEIDMRMVAQTNTLDGVRRAIEHYFIPSPMQRASTIAVILLANNSVSGTVDAIPELVRRAPRSKIIAQLDDMGEATSSSCTVVG
jgi:hypothetical protein